MSNALLHTHRLMPCSSCTCSTALSFIDGSVLCRKLIPPWNNVSCVQIFPHHENEIAQSQACACDHDKQQMDNNGTDFVRFWLHNGFVKGILL